MRLVLGGQFLSGVDTRPQAIAQAWLVLDLRRWAVALAMIATLQFLPMLVLSLCSGVLADRLPRRYLLLVTQTVLMLQDVVVAALRHLAGRARKRGPDRQLRAEPGEDLRHADDVLPTPAVGLPDVHVRRSRSDARPRTGDHASPAPDADIRVHGGEPHLTEHDPV